MKIEETTEYESFHIDKCNRPVDEASVIALMLSIQSKNLLRSKPILVDADFNIIDGQHRLEAARRLGIPIPYYIEETATIDDVIKLNTNQKNWGIGDYLNYYANKGYPDYVKLDRFCKNQKIPLNIAIQLLNNNRTMRFFKNYRNGNYKFPNEEGYQEALNKNSWIQETIQYVKEKTSGPKHYLDKVTFYGALVEFFNIKSFAYEKFKKKLQYKLDLLRPCTRHADYVTIFKNIYNWKNSSPLHLEQEDEET